MEPQTIPVKQYLEQRGIRFTERNGELIMRCIFSDCDSDSRPNEAHLYVSSGSSQYDCKKCGAQGNIWTLSKHFGDQPEAILLNPKKIHHGMKKSSSPRFNEGLVEKCNLQMPPRVRQYLNERGIPDGTIEEFKLGHGSFYGKNWITIPVSDEDGKWAFFKLREDPTTGKDKMVYAGEKNTEAQVYGWEILEKGGDSLFIVEGELDRLLLMSKGIPAITSTAGAKTFKEEWALKLKKFKRVYICFDNDDTGREGAQRVAKMLERERRIATYIVTLPAEVGEKGDITDYFTKVNGSADDLFGKYAKSYPEPMDGARFSPLSGSDVARILGLTIKKDETNKLVTFLCQLSAYTEDSQFNISFNAPSSTGKSYLPLEISALFPKEDVIKLGNCSTTAFFHEQGVYDKETNTIYVDVSRRIIIFLDQPGNALLERMRPMLSHDEKEMRAKITDKNQKGGNRTKTVVIVGFPSVIFCTAGLRIDEQEATRFLLLSPEVNQEKIREGILQTIKKETDKDAFAEWLEADPERRLLMERIRAIRQAQIDAINISSEDQIIQRFFSAKKFLKPRHQRDVKRLISIIKAFALLNLWWREQRGHTIIANEQDVAEAFKIWEEISTSQELNLPPYVYGLYTDVIMSLFERKNANAKAGLGQPAEKAGITRKEILQRHYEVYGRMLDGNMLRQQILPMLETAGLIEQTPDKDDKRKMLVYPTVPITGIDTLSPLATEYGDGDSGVHTKDVAKNSDARRGAMHESNGNNSEANRLANDNETFEAYLEREMGHPPPIT